MPTPTYDLIASSILSTTTGDLTFSSIPDTYRDLVLVINAGQSSSTNTRMRFNSNNTNVYNRVIMTGNGSTATSGTTANDTEIPITSSSANTFFCVVQIFDYSATDKHKALIARNNYPAAEVDARAGRWANTAAINSIYLFTSSVWPIGSTFYLYGIVS
jgi:hypothetical protein